MVLRKNKDINFFLLWLNFLIKNGCKGRSEKSILNLIILLKQKEITSRIKLFENITRKVRPVVEVRNKKVTGKIYGIPRPILRERGLRMGVRWVLEEIREKPLGNFEDRLLIEILEIVKNSSKVIRRKLEIQKDAIKKKPYLTYY
jgi:ribosomal protein S7